MIVCGFSFDAFECVNTELPGSVFLPLKSIAFNFRPKVAFYDAAKHQNETVSLYIAILSRDNLVMVLLEVFYHLVDVPVLEQDCREMETMAPPASGIEEELEKYQTHFERA